MGSAIQAGDSAISRCRNRELNTAEPDTAEEGARVLAGRVINVLLATAINGQLRSLRGQSSCLVSYVIAHDRSNSRAESAGSIPVTRSTVKSQVKPPS